VAHPLAEAHILGQARLRVITRGAIERIWGDLPGYDRRNVDEWLSRVLPVVSTSQRASVALTEAYLASYLERAPLGLDGGAILERARVGASAEEVYFRPFVNVWSALGAGKSFEDAIASGLARATGSAAMDVQLAMRETAGEVQEAGDGIYGYQRVADGGACEFCQAIDGAYLKSGDASPLHNNCGCGLEPLTAPHPTAAFLPSGEAVRDDFAIREHGELGAVLVAPDQQFTSESEI
jgi:hypothetical protein